MSDQRKVAELTPAEHLERIRQRGAEGESEDPRAGVKRAFEELQSAAEERESAALWEAWEAADPGPEASVEEVRAWAKERPD